MLLVIVEIQERDLLVFFYSALYGVNVINERRTSFFAFIQRDSITLSEFFKEEENEDELIRRVKTLSQENKTALLQILKCIR